MTIRWTEKFQIENIYPHPYGIEIKQTSNNEKEFNILIYKEV